MSVTGSGPAARARLGSFELDLRSGELRQLGADSSSGTVLLREQPFQILRMLIDRGGKIVTRAEIQKALWPNDTIVDFDHSINVAIGALRRALGDSASNPRYIETLGRRGYRLLLAVDWARTGSESDGTAAATPASPLRALGDLIGRKIGHYRVLEVLGGGGMGMVYKAEDLKLGRQVALKFLPEELASDAIALARLEGEARTASALNHPNICTIFDIEEYAGQKFIAMELLEGETLLQRIAASAPGPIPRPEATDIAVQVCTGLQAAHEKGIVHRDVKPGNIFLTRQGPVKILDFGVAKLVAAGDAGGETDAEEGAVTGVSPVIQPGLTGTGASVGTRGYMSPEQVRKQPLDARSDLFSLGLVLYEMATGRRAFADEAPTGTHDPSVDAPPPRSRAVNPAIPRALDAIISRALETDPARRYQTAAEMRRDLERTRERTRLPARRRIRYTLAGAVVVVLVASGTWLWRARSTVTLAPDDTVLIGHVTNETTDRVFDEALYTALRVALEQTPYMNVLADSKVRGELKALNLAESTRVTPQIALDICRRTGSKIVVTPSIADAGNRLRLELSGLDCRSGARVARVEHEAASKDAVIHTLGVAATQLRALLGEPGVSVARFNTPLDQATSASPDAVELLTLGYRRHLAGNPHDAVPYYERAIRADPDFALAHAALAVAHVNQAQTMLAAASARRAFELRQRLTLPARFNVESAYYRDLTGQIDVACEVTAQWVQTFPHDLVARQNFGICLADLGEPDRALGQAREAARILPAPWTYLSWVERSVEADRLDEARSAYEEALRRNFDSPHFRDRRALIAFLERDEETMRAQWKWAEGKAGAEPILLSGRARSEAYHGRLRASLQLAKTAAALWVKEGEGEASRVELYSTLLRAEAGLRDLPVATGVPDQSLTTRALTALTLARTGKLDQAREAADTLRRDFPSHTLLQKYCLPVIEAAVKLQSSDPAGAIEALGPAARYELTSWIVFPNLYSAYLRGLAQLRMRDGQAAAAEFQKLLAHPGLVGRWAIGAMARLQLARAQQLSGNDAAALSSYEEFLSLWKDADDDLPLYREARAELRSLRSGR